MEAIIQLPSDEFFNTGITTYLWIFNKDKALERKDKVILIDASAGYAPRQKSKGKKRVEMNDAQRAKIVEQLMRFKNSETSKVFSK